VYKLSDKQIDFILNDIKTRGIEMASLQLSILDHVCCIIEEHLEENGDFENFYKKTIASFYKDALWEIEEETINLLIYKNYYTMKKTMIISGIFSAVTLSAGIIFKFMYWPGAAALIVLGILAASLIFLPLMFTIKAKEKQTIKDKFIISIGAVVSILTSLSILFKIMHWPYANMMGLCSILIMIFIFLPIYFITGVKNPETKINTITSSVLIILGCGLLLTLIRSPRSSYVTSVRITHDYLLSQQILKTEKQLFINNFDSLIKSNLINQTADSIFLNLENLKSFILETETGYKTIDNNFEKKGIVIEEHGYNENPFYSDANTFKNYELLRNQINTYNNLLKSNVTELIQGVPTQNTFIDVSTINNFKSYTTTSLLNQITHLQLLILQNQITLNS
jgi:hypothetical protein